jgi:hypothetical protein
MTAQAVGQMLEALQLAGLTLALTPEHALKVAPASRLTPQLRELIQANKGELIAWLATEEAPASPESAAALPDNQTAESSYPDRWCWPDSTAMNGTEINAFTERIHLFGSRGLNIRQAEALADKLLQRDRDLDERRVCLECAHLQFFKESYLRSCDEWRCGNWKVARLCLFARDAELSEAITRQLQRCDGFNAVPHPN